MDSEQFSVRPFQGPPPTTAHKTIGTLNLVFGGLLMLCGLCNGVSALSQVVIAPMSEEIQKNVQKEMLVQHNREIQKKVDAIKIEEDAATTQEEKERLAARRLALEKLPPPELPFGDMMGMYKDPRLVGFVVTDFISGILLNMALFASGLGLLSSKSWGRQLGVWVASIKIVRLVLVYGYFIAVIAPFISQKLEETFGKFADQVAQQQQQQNPGQPAPPKVAKMIGTFYNIAMTVFGVCMILLGVIYPIIMLRVLTRPKVKLACGEGVAIAGMDAS